MIIVVKLKLFILTQFGGNRMLGVFWLTTDCNMKCIYCYEGNEKKKMYMNEETIDKAIEFLMTRAKELKDNRHWKEQQEIQEYCEAIREDIKGKEMKNQL